jgi:hypothetical protein
MYFKSHSWVIFLAGMNGRMDLIQTIKEAWSGMRMGLRPMRAQVLEELENYSILTETS